MDAAPSYHVIFSGKLREGFTQPQVKQALNEKLKLPAKQLELMFSGKPLVMKRTQSADEAKKLLAVLASLGAIARIQSDKKAPQAAAKSVTPQPAIKPAVELPRFSPFPKGGKLITALVLAATSEMFFAILYALMLFTFSVGLLHATFFTTWGTAVTGFGPLALLLQLIALPLGMILLFLVAKPLWAFNPQHRQGAVVNEEQEPKLHAFVKEVCEQISTPVPLEIRITNSSEVELTYLGGPVGFVMNRHLLTIGAPLVAACDTSQLAALVAQSLQLSHSKSLSPRAAFLLRSSDAWLQRAIYGKDKIDRKLQDLIEEQSIYTPLIQLLQKLITVSRRVLGWRLLLSRHINRSLMHRLVADADKVSLVFTGSAGFRTLIEQQRLLAYASQKTLPGLMERWRKEESLPDNLIQAMVLRCKQFPAEIHQQLRVKQEKQKAASHDTIPADSQRLRRVSKIEVAAAYPDNSAATSLFRNFTKLAKTMTVRLYHTRLGIPVSPDRLASAATPDKAMQQQQQHIDAIFQQMYFDLIPLKLRHRMKMVGSFEEGVSMREKAVKEIDTTHSHTRLAHKRCEESEQAVVDISTQEVMYRAELWKRWGMQPESKDGLEQFHRACREQEKGLEENLNLLAHQLQPYVQRMAISLALLNTPEGEKIGKNSALYKEVEVLIDVLERIEQAAPQLRSLKLHTTLLRILLSYDGSGKGKLNERIQEQAGDIRQLLAGLGAGFKTTPYPFGNSHKNLMSFALHGAYTDETPDGDFDRGNDMVEQITRVQRHILGRLCAIALHVEKSLAL